MALVLLGIVVVGLVGFIVDRSAGWLEHRLLTWRTT
jgi:sulfonate transport system permease protein